MTVDWDHEKKKKGPLAWPFPLSNFCFATWSKFRREISPFGTAQKAIPPVERTIFKFPISIFQVGQSPTPSLGA